MVEEVGQGIEGGGGDHGEDGKKGGGCRGSTLMSDDSAGMKVGLVPVLIISLLFSLSRHIRISRGYNNQVKVVC